MPRIEVISHADATGELKDIYDGLVKSRGQLARVHQIQSLRPKSITAHMDLYMEIMYSRSELSRADRELLGTAVSIANGCHYCTRHHGEALNKYWKDDARLEQFVQGEWETVLDARQLAMAEFAKGLTQNPAAHEDQDFTDTLRVHGLSDAAILDAVLVTAYFNFVNRMVLSLGIELEEDGGKGYRY